MHGIATSPFNGQLFATCGADGSLRVYSAQQTAHILSLQPSAGALFACQWSPFRPLLAAAATSNGQIVLYDLMDGGGDAMQPSKSFQAGGVLRTGHSTDVESPPSPPRVCMSIHPEGKSCSHLGSSACSQ